MVPRFSIVIATYNRAEFLSEAIDSVLAQTLGDVEVVVVDDGSTDTTPAVMARYAADARVRYESLGRNCGRSAARNRGVQLARAERLGFLDADDRYLPAALATHWSAHDAQPALGMTVGGFETVGPDGVGEGAASQASGDLNRLSDWLFDCFGRTGSVLLRRSWFERVGGFDESLEMAEDWDLFLRLARAGCPMQWVAGPLFQYRQHAGNSMHDIDRHRQCALRMLEQLFRGGGLSAEVAALENAAKAWVNVWAARRHYAAGQDARAATALECALALDPRLAGAKKIALLETLMVALASPDGAPPPLRGRLPAALRASPAELRRAASRVAMAQFFRLQRHAGSEARRHLRNGLRLDPRWLANRGVLAFLLRHGLRA
jgi:glycosyltransferase involved in cell wall biosynthesis